MTSASAPRHGASAAGTPAICRVLIIDDSPEDREFIRRFLLRDPEARYQFSEASTASQGIELCSAASGLPDCVLLDMSLPDLDGLEVIEALKNGADDLPLPVLVLTGSDSSMREGRAALAAGAQDFLGKSWITPEGLSRAIANAIERFRLNRRIAENERRFRSTFENAAVGIAHVALDGSWQMVNQRLCDIVGYSRGELLARTFQDITAPEDLAGDLDLARRLVAGELATYALNKRYVRRDGSLVWVNITVSLVRDELGAPVNFITIVEDISERKQAEDQLRDSEEQFRAMFSISSFGKVQVDAGSGHFLRVNGAFCALTGYSESELLQLRVIDVTHPDDRAEDDAGLRRMARGELSSYDVEKRYLRKDGSVVWVHVTANVIYDRAGKALRFTAVIQDISARRAAERERAQLARLIDASGDFIAIADLDGRVTYLNPGGRRMIGLAPHADLGELRFTDYVPEAWQGFFRDTVIESARRTGSWEGEMQLRNLSTGALIDVFRYTFLIRDPHTGEPWCYATVTRDITARKHAATVLRESAARLRLGVEVADFAICQIDYGSGVNHLSKEAARTYDLGDRPISLPRAAVHATFHPDDAEAVAQRIAEALDPAGRGWFACEHRIVRRTGEVRWLNVRKQIFFDRSGDRQVPTLGILAAQDITERKQAEEKLRASENQLRQYAEQLQQADQRKNEFLATLAHELRNPLAPIRNAVALLKQPNLKAEHFAFARDITESQLDVMVRLIDDLLDISRISHGKIALKKQWVDLKTIVDQALETARLHIEANGHQLTIDIPEEEVWLDGDRVRLAQVISNLINNACKYSEKNGRIELRARLECIADCGLRNSELSDSESASRAGDLEMERHGDLGKGGVAAVGKSAISNPQSEMTLVVSVRDEGIGISPEHLPRLFEMFSQVESSLTRSKGGLGIGLSLVKGLVELHGGTVQARSEGIGKGSEFIVYLPVNEVVSGELRGASPSRVSMSDSELAAPASRLMPKDARQRILIVDDNPMQARSLALLLETMGFETRFALSGADGLGLIADFRPQAVFIDIGLPDMTGYELAQRLRLLPELKGITLIAQTGWGRAEDRAQAMRAGFDHHLTKPIEQRLLEQILMKP